MYRPRHNSVVQAVTVAGGHALHLEAHVDVVRETYYLMYGVDPGDQTAVLAGEIRAAAADFPSSAALLAVVEFWPGEDAVIEHSVGIGGRLLYRDYVLWHTRLRAGVTPYCSFMEHLPCTSSLLHSAYALRHARDEGFDAALHVSSGALTGLAWEVRSEDSEGWPTGAGVGEYPVFCVGGGEVCTPSRSSGAQNSVFLMLGLAALEVIGRPAVVRDISAEELVGFEEVFAVTAQGVVSLKSCVDKLLVDFTAGKVAEAMAGFFAKSPL